MEILLTEVALEHFRSLQVTNQYIRLHARDINSCNVAVEYEVFLDEPKSDDKIAEVDSFRFIYNEKASKEIGGYVKIDYVPSLGIKLTNKNQILAYGLKLKTS